MAAVGEIALLGTGLMGAPMTRSLLKGGYSVTVWNRTQAKAEKLSRHGATVAASPGQAATGADFVVTMLESGTVVADVVFGQGVAQTMSASCILIDMSSIPPDMARDHAARLAVKGTAYLDAPVSGGTRGAESGTLAIMVGGERATYERAAKVLASLGNATYVGSTGSGQIAKLTNQVIVADTICAVAEGLLLAASAGADPAAVREALLGGFAESRILREHGRRMLERDFVAGGTARNQLKDLEAARAVALEQGVKLPVTEAVTTLFEQLVADGLGDYDHSALLLELERLNSGV